MFQRIFIITAICFLAAIFEGKACRCKYLEIHEAVKHADVIFTGEILGRNPVFESDTSGIRVVRIDIAVKVKEVLKGNLQINDTIFIYEPTTEIKTGFRIFAPCTVNFIPQKDYVIYGAFPQKHFSVTQIFITTGSCSRTSIARLDEIAGIKEELAPPQTFPVAFKRFFRNLFKGIFWE
jgi:hypothetical protein